MAQFVLFLLLVLFTDGSLATQAAPCPPRGSQSYQIANIEDCKTFYLCDENQPNKAPTLLACSSGLHFNENIRTCDWPSSANCKYPLPATSCPVCGTNQVCDTASSKCVCKTGYSGDPCTQNPPSCPVCGTNQVCDTASSKCVCKTGYSGDPCTQNPPSCPVCGTNQVCDTSTAKCVCKTGYSGDPCTDINECSKGICKDGCTNTQGSYTCYCTDSRYCLKSDGVSCEPCACQARTCINGGKCILIGADQTQCQCPPGYTGTSCETDIDECKTGAAKCLNQCTNTVGSFTCSCKDPDSYLMDDGVTCQPQACRARTCTNGGKCIVNSDRTTKCECPSGFTGDACETALTSDPCGTVKCKNNGQCVVKTGQPTCSCQPGFTGSLCETAMNCAAANCMNGANCKLDTSTSPSTATCICQPGYIGSQCETYNKCYPITCKNGGKCELDLKGEPKCVCVGGYSGDTCQTAPQGQCKATGLVCLNGGQCVDTTGTATCSCASGYTGKNCDTKIDGCPEALQKSCLNGGSCVNNNGDLSCKCADKFTGQFCDKYVSCDGVTCLNEAKCAVTNNVAACQCLPGTSGANCQIKKACGANNYPCLNNGVCMDTDQGFVCLCDFGHKGLNCQTVRECGKDLIDCLNGGKCQDNPTDGAKCVCAADYIGKNCEIRNDACGGCQNGGKCLRTVFKNINPPVPDADIYCSCPQGYRGHQCQIPAPCTLPCSPEIGKGKPNEYTVSPNPYNDKELLTCQEGMTTEVLACKDTAVHAKFNDCLDQAEFESYKKGSFPPR